MKGRKEQMERRRVDRGRERRSRGGEGEDVVLLIVVRCPEVQERTVRPLGALLSPLSSISVLISF